MQRIFTVLLITISLTSSAQVDSSQSIMTLNGKYFSNFLSDAGYVYSGPFRWSGKQWTEAGAIIGGTLALYFLADEEVAKIGDKEHEGFLETVAEIVEPYGNGRFAVGYPIATYLVGAAIQNDRVKRTGLLMFESYIIVGVTYQASLYVFSRNRPDTGAKANNSFLGPRFRPKQSFISGHSAIAFALSTTLAMEFKDTKWVPPVVYSLAAMTSLSRVYDDRHWISDVFIGAAAGHFISKTIVRRQWKRDEGSDPKLSFLPTMSPVGPMLTIRYDLN